MVELCLMSSSSLPGLVLQQDRSLFGAFDDCLPLLRNHCAREETTLSTSLNLKPLQLEASWSPVAGLSDSSKFISVDSAIARPVVIDLHESRSNPILLGYRVAEKCTRREEVMQFLTSRSNEVEENMLNPSLLSDLMGLQPPTSNMQQSPTAPFDYLSSQNDTDADTWSSLVYPTGFLHTEKPLLDFMGDLARDSKLIFGLDGQVLFNGTGSEMKDLLLFVAEFYLSKNPTSLRKQSVVPYFHRRARKAARGSATVKAPTVTSPEKVNLKPSTNKSSNKAVKGKNSYEKDYFRACEILLSLMMNKKRQDKTLLLLLKKSGPELGELLTQCSASIAGTGVAIVLSVVCKLACARVPMCGSKIISSGLGLGLVWLSWAVNRLRDDIVQVSKNPSKVSSGE
uniref:Uncharacterized protein n=1 Tax=Kalanchoe fedtschenkoi TaxID=63787 RepID=A0A7N0TAE7_KALFE